MFGGNFIGVSDYKNIPLHEGDIIQWPNQEALGVIRYEKNSCQLKIKHSHVMLDFKWAKKVRQLK